MGEVDFIDEASGKETGIQAATALTEKATYIPLLAQPSKGGGEVESGVSKAPEGVGAFGQRGAAGEWELAGGKDDEWRARFTEEAGAEVGPAVAGDENA